MRALKAISAIALIAFPISCLAGMIDDAKVTIRAEREAQAIASLRNAYAQEVAIYRANPDREGKRCYEAASVNWRMWSGLPKAEFEACDAVVRQEIISIRTKAEQSMAAAKSERAERRKGMSEVAAKLDEMDERMADRERELDRRDASRAAANEEEARRKAKTDAIDADLAGAKRLSCSMGNRKDC
jgi:hypothetical protein